MYRSCWRRIASGVNSRRARARACSRPAAASFWVPRAGQSVHHGTTDFVGRTIRTAQASGIEHECLDGAEVMRRFPQIAGADGTRAYFEPGGGFVRPERCIAAQLAVARRLGARTMKAEVQAIRQVGRGVEIGLADETIEAGHAVIAAGPWTPNLAGAPLDRLLTVNRQVLHWFPADGAVYAPGRFPTVIWMHGVEAEDYFYAFPAVRGTGLVKAATEQYAVATRPDAVARTVSGAELQAMFERHLSGRLNGVGTPAAKVAVCMYTVTPDSSFIIDRHPAMAAVIVVAACSGHGFKHSAGIGELVAGHVAEGTPLPSPFALARFAAAS